MSEEFRPLVVGGGVSGLYAAWQLELAGFKPRLVSTDIGGLLRQFGHEEFRFDLGGHVYADHPLTRPIFDALGRHPMQRKAFYHDVERGRFVEYPVQDHYEDLGLPAFTGGRIPEFSPALSLRELAVSAFGESFYSQWYAPFNERVWGTDLGKMSADWIQTRVKLPTDGEKKWGPNAAFFYAPGGDIISYLRRQLKWTEFVHDRVVGIDLDQKPYCVIGERDIYRFGTPGLFWTLPLLDLPVDLARGLRPFVPIVDTLSVGLALRRPYMEVDFHWVYNDVRRSVHRITNLGRYDKSLCPSGTGALLLEIPMSPLRRSRFRKWMMAMNRGSINAPDLFYRRGDFVKALVDDIHLPGLSYEDVEWAASVRFNSYPVPIINARHHIARAKQLMSRYGIWSFGRWGSHGYFNLPDCFMDAKEAVESAVRWGRPMPRYLMSSHYYKVYDG